MSERIALNSMSTSRHIARRFRDALLCVLQLEMERHKSRSTHVQRHWIGHVHQYRVLLWLAAMSWFWFYCICRHPIQPIVSTRSIRRSVVRRQGKRAFPLNRG